MKKSESFIKVSDIDKVLFEYYRMEEADSEIFNFVKDIKQHKKTLEDILNETDKEDVYGSKT